MWLENMRFDVCLTGSRYDCTCNGGRWSVQPLRKRKDLGVKRLNAGLFHHLANGRFFERLSGINVSPR